MSPGHWNRRETLPQLEIDVSELKQNKFRLLRRSNPASAKRLPPDLYGGLRTVIDDMAAHDISWLSILCLDPRIHQRDELVHLVHVVKSSSDETVLLGRSYIVLYIPIIFIYYISSTKIDS